MMTIDVLGMMALDATEYRITAIKSVERNRHMNKINEGEQLDQRHIDAILVDFINYIGSRCGIDYGLNTKDIEQL